MRIRTAVLNIFHLAVIFDPQSKMKRAERNKILLHYVEDVAAKDMCTEKGKKRSQ